MGPDPRNHPFAVIAVFPPPIPFSTRYKDLHLRWQHGGITQGATLKLDQFDRNVRTKLAL